jgi:hypothetical protein
MKSIKYHLLLKKSVVFFVNLDHLREKRHHHLQQQQLVPLDVLALVPNENQKEAMKKLFRIQS